MLWSQAASTCTTYRYSSGVYKIFLFLQIKLFYVKTLYVYVAVGCTNAFNLSGIKNLIYLIQLGVIIITMKHFNVHVADGFS